MKHTKLYIIVAFLFTSILGTLAHFFYDWSGQNVIVGLFTPVNESTWEHMKLVFFPALLCALFTPSSVRENFPSLPDAVLLGNLLGTLSIPVFFYTYSGILGTNKAVVDIAIFFLCVLITFFTAWKLRDSHSVREYRISIRFCTAVMAVLFMVFTFFPPDIGLFWIP